MNISYLHAKVNAHRMKLTRWLLRGKDNDNWTDDPALTQIEAIKHFQQQLKSDINIDRNPDLLEIIPNIVNQFHNKLIMENPNFDGLKLQSSASIHWAYMTLIA